MPKKKRSYGDGGVRKRGDSWELSYYDAHGKRRFVSVKGGTLADAKKELRKILSDIERGEHTDRSRLTVATHIDNWLAAIDASLLARKTKKRYRELLEQYVVPEIGETKLQSLTKERVKTLYSALLTKGRKKPKLLADGTETTGLSPQTVKHVHRALHLAFESAVEDKIIRENPASIKTKSVPGMTVPKRKKLVLGEGRLRAFLEALKNEGSDLYLPAVLYGATGARRSEILAIAWRHIDFDNGTLAIERALEPDGSGDTKAPKNESSIRIVPLPAGVVTLLRAERTRQAEELLKVGAKVHPDHFVFRPHIEEPLKPWGPDWVSLKFLRKARELGFEGLNLHAMRHTHVSVLIGSGAPLAAVSSRVGHADVRTTLSIYTHSSAEAEAVAAKAADEIMSRVLK